MLLRAERPLVYAGEGVIYADAVAELKTFAELANAPVVTTLKAKGAFPEDHPLFLGVRGDHVVDYLERSDLIFALGASLSPGRFSHGMPGWRSRHYAMNLRREPGVQAGPPTGSLRLLRPPATRLWRRTGRS